MKKKLTLNKQTIINLKDAQLTSIYGGGTYGTNCWNTCLTCQETCNETCPAGCSPGHPSRECENHRTDEYWTNCKI